MMKRFLFTLLAAFALTFTDARAEMPQTDVELVQQMGDADGETKLEALEIFYDLHASELEVQFANERVTGSFFAVQRAEDVDAAKREELENAQTQRRMERDERVQENRALRKQLENVSGIEFLQNLMVTPEVPMSEPKAAPAGAPADLVKARDVAWADMKMAEKALDAERLILFEAQQRYNDGEKVPIGDHLRAMTAAELGFTRAVSKYRLLEAKIAVASGNSVAEVLAGL